MKTKKLKTKTTEEGISIGEAVTKAISEWLGFSKKKRSIIEIEPEHFGYQYRNLSEMVDEALYNYEESSTPINRLRKPLSLLFASLQAFRAIRRSCPAPEIKSF